MRLLRYSLLVALVVALCALLVPAASISGPIEDCADDGQLQGNYTNQQKQQALKNLPSDLSEYSDCGEMLNSPNPSGLRVGSGDRARGGSGSGGGGGGGTTPEPRKRPASPPPPSSPASAASAPPSRALANGAGKPSLKLDGKSISPGDAGLYDLASATHAVPTPIKLVAAGGLPCSPWPAWSWPRAAASPALSTVSLAPSRAGGRVSRLRR